MTASSVLVTERDFARTYDGGTYDDAWRAVQQYRHAVSFSVDHPDQGYTSIATKVGFPQSRVRSWVAAGHTPSVVSGLYAARKHGWIDISFTDNEFMGLNILVASIYSGGMIASDHWQPIFTLTESEFDSKCVTALELSGVGYTVRKESNSNRGKSVRPGEDGAILGRVLHVLGAPVGSKAHSESLSLPWYLEEAPLEVRKQFVQAYLSNRSTTSSDSHSVQIIEERSDTYREELAELIESIAGEPVTAGDRSVTISAAAVESLGLDSERLR
mgnify:FL=1